MSDQIDTGVLYREDNINALSNMPSNSVDLVYLDPPFFSNRSYEVIWGDEAEVRSFEDRWEGGIQVYIDWMRNRVRHLYRILKSTGSLYLHCDPHASHYLKVMLDEIFTVTSFRNEVIWKRTGSHNSARRWGPQHDAILFYSKSDAFTWNKVYQAYDLSYVEEKFKYEDARGRYQDVALTGPGRRAGDSGLPWRGVDPNCSGRHWAIPSLMYEYFEKITGRSLSSLPISERLDEADRVGLIHWPAKRGGQPRFKQYLHISPGVPVQDVVVDVHPINSRAAERLGYPTQKPEALLKRIIESSSNVGDIVVDPFCGCGTAVSAAQQLGRRWIGIDISPTAMEIIRQRMRRVTSSPIQVLGMPDSEESLRRLKPFEFQNWVIQKFVGTHSPRLSGDMGIDGYSFMVNHPIQVKRSDRVGRNVIDNFETAMRRGKHEVGYVVAFSFTRNAREEAARARWADGLEVRLITVKNLLEPRLDEKIPELASVSELPLPPSRSAAARPTPEDLIASDKAAG
ncbi:DNA methyltransferase [Amycolatopsis vancoresmycina]|uniref:Modification methylase EcaI n=1 Tax=Amycolatopsis vancoresmycina DSM 44592 TaxID=1292037 RepID=R1I1U9_9PSEU|nr:DNA methyltransferase [Amycolatopsis vancoresmycina]EOD64429.1 modification methylase EcaI [Amycolatopsis vancoresmycina DSM 44592]